LGATERVYSHRFLLLPSNLLLFYSTARYTTLALHSMAKETVHNPPSVNPPVNDDDTKSDFEVESTTITTSSSPTCGATKIVEGKILELSNFFKKMTIIEEEHQAYHDRGWVADNLISTIPEVDVPTVHDSIVICFESHLSAGLGLPPTKLLVSIMNYLGCALVHFNLNAITALSSFAILCECWLGISLDTSLFWYYYSLAWYNKMIYSRIELSLRRHHWEEYIKASFKICWKGSQRRWVLVDMHVPAPWDNKLLFPLIIKAQRKEPPMTNSLSTLVNCVVELYKVGLKACHCVEEFHIRRIHPLGRQETLAYECPWMVNPNRNLAGGKIFTHVF
jgi:hypothetical protein